MAAMWEEHGEKLMQLFALGSMASVCVWVGSKRAARDDEDPQVDQERLGKKDALMFPVLASVTLVTMYVCFKYLPAEYVNYVMTGYFAVVGLVSVQTCYSPLIARVLKPLWKAVDNKISVHVSDVPLGDEDKATEAAPLDGATGSPPLVTLNRADIVGLVLGVATIGLYVWSGHWILTNIVGTSLAITAITVMKIDSFKVACILLGGLFFYDVFWVFGTDVMITIAKRVDGPIKILFPKDFLSNGIYSEDMGLLGLGDIVLPGTVISLLLRFDRSRAPDGNKDAAPTPYFHGAFIAYMAGLVTTFVCMVVFRAAQPALLYLVPLGLGTPLAMAVVRGELGALLAFGDDSDADAAKASDKKTD